METTNTIKPQDLRVGNIVKLKGTTDAKYILVVSEIMLDLIVAHTAGGDCSGYYYDRIEGIPVTEELLNKLGFVHRKSFLDGYKGFWEDSKGDWSNNVCVISDYEVGEIFLHDFQNRYYIFGKKELDVSPLYEEA